MLKERAKRPKVNQEAYAVLFKTLIENPCTSQELVEASGLAITTVQSVMRVFARHKIIHIGAWEPDRFGRDSSPVWKFGKGRNVPRRRKTRAENQAAYRDRKNLREMVNLTAAGAAAGAGA